MYRLMYLNVGDNQPTALPETVNSLTALKELRTDNTLAGGAAG
ncbi:MAG: hypothetical protein U0521_22720 [Anaerolineae bacterium]